MKKLKIMMKAASMQSSSGLRRLKAHRRLGGGVAWLAGGISISGLAAISIEGVA